MPCHREHTAQLVVALTIATCRETLEEDEDRKRKFGASLVVVFSSVFFSFFESNLHELEQLDRFNTLLCSLLILGGEEVRRGRQECADVSNMGRNLSRDALVHAAALKHNREFGCKHT